MPQYEGCVRFRDGQCRGNASDTTHYGGQTKQPAPALGLVKEATCNGP